MLKTAKLRDDAVEVVFYGADQGEETVRLGTPLEYKCTTNFARRMSVPDTMNSANMLCYEMNNGPLPAAHGFPCRLIVPGWYGIANVKWLTRIEVTNKRFLNRFMGRDYVTIREDQRDGKAVVLETSVGRMLLKSSPARVVERNGHYQIEGLAWGPSPIVAVEVKIDNGPWTKVKLGESKGDFVWRSWTNMAGDNRSARSTDTLYHVHRPSASQRRPKRKRGAVPENRRPRRDAANAQGAAHGGNRLDARIHEGTCGS